VRGLDASEGGEGAGNVFRGDWEGEVGVDVDVLRMLGVSRGEEEGERTRRVPSLFTLRIG